ncbi:hypothetical protein P10VF_246 [Rhizobium phage vB_RleM_P10VF]|uniref:Uncharacterized protein n=1 Tax=Rhizobium phage vB_RleM_P10VF TaxID=1527770 RepID=A0A076YNR8_9CAUD|nr:hypothetical protein P10VF_246 [Rhizobium phage vB_RleM_P10VF]AIK68459.1 hypothetical protein P10VF_246 [Rhizobium phage vB_RleM_P10VF]
MTSEFEKATMRITRADYEALPTLQQLREQGLNGRDLVGRKYRSAIPERNMIFKKTVRKSENHHQGKVSVTQIWEAEFI